MLKKTLIIFIALLFTLPTFAQEYTTKKTTHKKALKAYKEARTLNRAGNSADALKALDKALKKDPTFIDAKILRASVYGVMGDLAKAEIGFEEVVNWDVNYSPRVLYELALTEMEAQKYEEAVPHLEQYIESKSKSEKRKAKAKHHLVNAQFAAKALKNPVPFEATNLGEAINTNGQEYLPSFTADGEKFIFTARVNRQEDFFFSTKIDGEWQPRQPLIDINTDINEGAQCISADGQLLVFTSCNPKAGMGGCDLHFAKLENGHWTTPEKIKGPINTAGWEGQPSLSANGQTLYFASDRAGGIGKRDIWKSRRQKNGHWGKPVNLGKTINTKANDQCAFIHPDGETLYFCSEGWPGMGGIDLYFSRKDSFGEWQMPQNIGYPINTTANEGTLVVSTDGKTAYFASDKKSIKSGEISEKASSQLNIDIYSFPLYEAARPNPVTYVKAKVVDARTKRGLKAKAEIIDSATGQIFAQTTTDEKGNFLLCLPAGKDYVLHTSREKFFSYSETFSLADNADIEHPFLIDIALQPIPKTASSPKVMILHNIFFESGSAVLKDTSMVELTRLYTLLNENKNLKIEVNGHTDDIGNDTDNQILSENRAKAVCNYLIINGIPANRLAYKGLGELHPIADNKTAEGRQQNRRTEVLIFEE